MRLPRKVLRKVHLLRRLHMFGSMHPTWANWWCRSLSNPDALVAQILAASTYGPQVVEAESFVRRNASAPPEELARIVDVQPWDPSVKALTTFPAVLSNLSTNYAWTTKRR